MYECYSHALCDKAIATKENETCGNTIFAQMYFSTFIFFSMFLVSYPPFLSLSIINFFVAGFSGMGGCKSTIKKSKGKTC